MLRKLSSYKVPQFAVDLIRSTKIVFLVGVAGAGKDTVINHLLKNAEYHHVVSHTTRSPRRNHGVMEQEGTDRYFVDPKTIERMLDNQEFVEAKLAHGNIYGTSVAEIKKAHDQNKIALSEIEVQGVAEYRAVDDNVVPIFLLPPDFETWQKRLAGRYEGQANPDDIKERMKTAKVELQEALEKPYFEYVVNADIETTIEIVDKIAHGKHSTKKNEQAKEIARQLLRKL